MLNRILIYNSGGGIGDAIQLMTLIKTLKSQFKNSKFYYLSAHENHFNSSFGSGFSPRERVIGHFVLTVNKLNKYISHNHKTLRSCVAPSLVQI